MRASLPARISKCFRAPCYPSRQSNHVVGVRPVLHTTPLRSPYEGTSDFSTVRSNQYNRLVPASKAGDPASWYELLQDIVPALFEEPKTTNVGHRQNQTLSPSARSDLTQIVALARDRANVDVLSYCGVQQQQWQVMRRGFVEVIRGFNPRYHAPRPLRFPSNIQWPESVSLDDLTQGAFKVDMEPSPTIAQKTLAKELALAPQKGDVQAAATSKRKIIGYVLQSLASLSKLAATKERDESQAILSSVVSTLQYLQTRGLIPDAAYNPDLSMEIEGSHQSSQLATTFEQMKILLSDQTETGVGSFPNLQNPSSWVEFIIWICVHGRWLLEGASIVDDLSKAKWTIIKLGDDNHLPSAYQTISSQSVTTLIDGMLSLSVPMLGIATKNPMPVILTKIHALKRALDANKIRPGRSSWDAIIARFVDSPALTSMETNPTLVAEALNLAETYGKEAQLYEDSDEEQSSPAEIQPYIFEASAAVLGIYHRVLLASIRARNKEWALQALAGLQRLTDANKEKSLRQFFGQLRTVLVSGTNNKPVEGDWESISPFREVQYPVYFLDIPTGILGELLDLVSDTGAMDIGKWMIDAQDIDGPLIPPSLYKDQNVAPALFRFATINKDRELLTSVMAAQGTAVSKRTLLSICDNRIFQGDFDGAIEILEVLTEHTTRDWAVQDFSRLLKSLLLQLYGLKIRKDLNDEASQRAAQLLQRVLRDDMAEVLGASLDQINTLVGVLSSLDRHLSSLCSSLIPRGKGYEANLPIEAFNEIMEATVRIWGHARAKTLYEYWCVENPDRQVPLHGMVRSHVPGRMQPTTSELFSRPNAPDRDLASTETQSSVRFWGAIEPNIATIRTIVRELLEENDSGMPDSAERKVYEEYEDEILAWAAQELQTRFGLSRAEAQYELPGCLQSSKDEMNDTDMQYSLKTIRLWEVLTAQHRAWALGIEERLRTFLTNYSERQVLFEQQPATERVLLQSLASDYGLASESPPADGPKRLVRIYKTSARPTLPKMRIDEARILRMTRSDMRKKQHILNIMPAA